MTPTLDAGLLQTLLGLFEGLRRMPDGELLYKLIDRGLKKYSSDDARVDPAFLGFVHGLLGRYAGDADNNAAVRIKARVIQQRLASYLKQTPDTTTAPIAEPIAAIESVRGDELLPTPVPDIIPSITGERDAQTLLQAHAAGASDLAAFEDVKAAFMRGLDELIHSRQQLEQKLTSAAEYLKAVQVDREQLQQELATAKRHGSVDPLTGLPNRDVFARALAAEIGRVKRYGFALAVALIDLDGIGAINERHGRNTGDAILRCYARDIFSRFRAYDLVARYSGDAFAVLFPNTQKDGAMRALDKARQAATESVLTVNGRTLPLPSFSSALTLYTPGEQPATLLERADQALAAAKGAGGARTITALAAG